jgi:DNA gyrase subunit A
MKLLEVDELQANAILDMQLRRIAALERQKIIDEHDELMADIKELKIILDSPEKQREIIKDELTEVGVNMAMTAELKLLPAILTCQLKI